MISSHMAIRIIASRQGSKLSLAHVAPQLSQLAYRSTRLSGRACAVAASMSLPLMHAPQLRQLAGHNAARGRQQPPKALSHRAATAFRTIQPLHDTLLRSTPRERNSRAI